MREPLVDYTQTVDSIEIPVKRDPHIEKYGPTFYSDLGKKGGAALAAARGREFFVANGKKGGAVTKALYDDSHFVAIGSKGGNTTKARLGRDHFAAIARKRWAAKRAEAAQSLFTACIAQWVRAPAFVPETPVRTRLQSPPPAAPASSFLEEA